MWWWMAMAAWKSMETLSSTGPNNFKEGILTVVLAIVATIILFAGMLIFVHLTTKKIEKKVYEEQAKGIDRGGWV